MTLEEAIAYLRTWIKLNRRSAYGSGDDFIDADRLLSVLRDIEGAQS